MTHHPRPPRGVAVRTPSEPSVTAVLRQVEFGVTTGGGGRADSGGPGQRGRGAGGRGPGGRGARSSPPSCCSRVLLALPGAACSLPRPHEGTDRLVHPVCARDGAGCTPRRGASEACASARSAPAAAPAAARTRAPRSAQSGVAPPTPRSTTSDTLPTTLPLEIRRERLSEGRVVAALLPDGGQRGWQVSRGLGCDQSAVHPARGSTGLLHTLPFVSVRVLRLSVIGLKNHGFLGIEHLGYVCLADLRCPPVYVRTPAVDPNTRPALPVTVPGASAHAPGRRPGGSRRAWACPPSARPRPRRPLCSLSLQESQKTNRADAETAKCHAPQGSGVRPAPGPARTRKSPSSSLGLSVTSQAKSPRGVVSAQVHLNAVYLKFT